MMFAALPMQQQQQSQPQQPHQFQQSQYQQQQHTPTRPSPLSPHRTPTTTAATQFNLNFSSPFTTTPIKSPSKFDPISPSPTPQHQQPSSYAQRYASTISNPMTKHMMTSASPSARRNLFLNRVKRARDEGRFENRGEQLVLMEHVAEEKRWGEVMRRRAERLGGFGEEEDEVVGEEGIPDDMDAHALDEYLQEQAAEMERLEYLNDMYDGPHRQQSDGGGGGGGAGAGAGASFSDEEYDDLFMDLAEHQPHTRGSGQEFAHSQDMDMS
ncbi:hypothetical protein BO94DRAFT_575967 [Aspergillus sclerotioniger CBS 115572]|uniref:Uncharacterized protein n=1 Tax=Aspergillus sclerotioniger CBS 115572 TaxID=1450535 RepID=A0A317WK50_9EURO|nr:hypothetical protein BO94DRAFT_575967 [Aspergillus sclerotioniger CBS 115572]PWY84580.1 hypothetical protein BO94DRAFT_575967 [Aspergillus sclerotioniger CBS 115572]